MHDCCFESGICISSGWAGWEGDGNSYYYLQSTVDAEVELGRGVVGRYWLPSPAQDQQDQAVSPPFLTKLLLPHMTDWPDSG